MKAYVLHSAKDMRLEDRPDPQPGSRDVIIEIRRVGICGSDMHYYEEGKVGRFIPRAPFALGHEFSGEVVETGKEVTKFRKGDRVTVEPSIECGTCRYCRDGRYNLCVNMKFYGSASCYPHIDGGFAQLVVAPESHCYRLPEALDYPAGAMIEPFAVGAHGVLRAGVIAGCTALVSGAGTIGQTALVMARALGAGKIAVSDVAPFARQFALEQGADGALDPTAPDFAAQAERIAPGGFDLIIEASGSSRALATALEIAARGATLVQIGTLPAEVTIPANLIMSKQLTLAGSFRYAHVFQMVLDLAATGKIDVTRLVTQVYPFGKMQEAMDRALAKQSVIKVQVGA